MMRSARLIRKIQGFALNQLRKAARTFSLLGSPAASLDDSFRSSFELLDLIPQNEIRCIWDVGAADGSWTVLAASMFPEASVHAFEPQPQQADKIRSQLASLSNVRIHPVALGDEDGLSTLHVTNNLDSSSLRSPLEALERVYNVTKASTMDVEVCRGADIIRQGVPMPDLLKLDVQGHELSVIDGLDTFFSKVKYVICEFAVVPLYDEQPNAAKILYELELRGYQIFALGANTAVGQRIFEFDALLKSRSAE